MTTTIPRDIVDEIIKYLADDPAALKASSLAGKAWLPASRYHQFRNVRLLSLPGIGANIQLLCDPTSSVLPYIRRLCLIEGDDDLYDPKWLNRALPRILPNVVKLTALESLEVEDLSWEDLSPESRGCLRSIFSGLKVVSLSFPHFDSALPALELISSAPSLEHLTVRGMSLDNDEVNLNLSFDDLPLPPPLLTLDLDTGLYPVLDWLRIRSPKLKIKTLSLGAVTEGTVPSTSAFLKTLGPVLENLTVIFSNINPYLHLAEMAFCKEDILVHSTSLRTLSLEDQFRTGVTAPSGALQFRPIPAILRQVASPFIETVSIAIFPWNESVNYFLDVDDLRELFTDAEGVFSKRSTKLHIVGWSGFNQSIEFQDSLFKSLTSLHGQGRLKFSIP